MAVEQAELDHAAKIGQDGDWYVHSRQGGDGAQSEEGAISVEALAFARALRAAAVFALPASDSNMRDVLKGVMLSIDPRERHLRIVAMDGHKLWVHALPQSANTWAGGEETSERIIPIRAVRDWIKFARSSGLPHLRITHEGRPVTARHHTTFGDWGENSLTAESVLGFYPRYSELLAPVSQRSRAAIHFGTAHGSAPFEAAKHLRAHSVKVLPGARASFPVRFHVHTRDEGHAVAIVQPMMNS